MQNIWQPCDKYGEMRKAGIILLLLFVMATIFSCGPSYDEVKRTSRAERLKRMKEDSLALKIGVLPTMDCLPMYVAKETELFDTAKADIRLKPYKSNIDCDAALTKGTIEGNISDLVRGEYMKKRGTHLEYVSSTNTYWQLISNRIARIRQLKQLNDKMLAMTRFSATALLADYAVDSAKLKEENVFKIQINDVDLRLMMLLNNEMDAVLLPEPQATKARIHGNHVLMDGKDKDLRLGVLAFRSDAMNDKRRKIQIETFIKGYNAACDSINKNGIRHYSQILKKYYNIGDKEINALPKMKFGHVEPPRQKDINAAKKWLN